MACKYSMAFHARLHLEGQVKQVISGAYLASSQWVVPFEL